MARLEISIPTASFDGVFHGRYPHGDAPAGAVLAGAATDPTSGSGSLTTSGGGGLPAGPPGGSFQFFISTTGSDANVGSLASPWAITAINTKQSTYAGHNVGILPGTYDVSGLMNSGSSGNHGTALNINGGLPGVSTTYIGTCNSSGAYQPNTAILDAMGATGFFGGSNSNSSTVIGTSAQFGGLGGPTPANWGNWTLDGLDIINFSAWALQVGSFDGTHGSVPNATVQNCRFYNGNASFTTIGINSTHGGPMVIYAFSNFLISNCWFHNNINTGGNNTHWDAITTQGIGGGSSGIKIQFCSFVNSSGFYGIEDNGKNVGTEITCCYFDVTASSGDPNTQAMEAGVNGTAGQPGSSFHHNIIKGGGLYDNAGFQLNLSAQTIAVYNNTWDRAGGSGSTSVGIRCLEASGHTGLFTAYNNLMFDNGAGANSLGYMASNIDGFALCDFNIYGTTGTFAIYGANGGVEQASALSFATWKSDIGNLETHSSTNAANPFTNNGALALAYQIQSGSPAFQTGRVGGVSSGAVCNVGAWDGTVTQIGSALPQP